TVLEDRTVPSTFTVLNLNNAGPDSLPAAISAATATPGHDVIRFANGLQGTINLASQLSITDSLTINGSGAGRITVSGAGATRVLSISSSANVTLTDLTIANGLAVQGAGIDNAGRLTMSGCVLATNQAVGGPDVSALGGGIFNEVGATLSL